MDRAEAAGSGGSQTIATKLDARQLARFELAVAASGISRAAFIRAAVLRQMVPLRPYEPLMAEGIATLAACRSAIARGGAADDELVCRLQSLLNALHPLAGVQVR
jgi:hypothetical protein